MTPQPRGPAESIAGRRPTLDTPRDAGREHGHRIGIQNDHPPAAPVVRA